MRTSGDLLTTAEAAIEIGISVPTVLRWAKSGRLEPFRKIPGRTNPYMFDRAEVSRVAAERGLS